MEPKFDLEQYKQAVGSFVTGITVVSAVSEFGPVGFTCQSFTSLSINPPMILVSVAKTSRTFPAISLYRRFCVNILEHHAIEIARDFAANTTEKRFSKHTWRPNDFGNPVLDAAIAWLDCELEQTIEVEDHLVMVGKVKDLGVSLLHQQPLTYFRGHFGGFSEYPT